MSSFVPPSAYFSVSVLLLSHTLLFHYIFLYKSLSASLFLNHSLRIVTCHFVIFPQIDKIISHSSESLNSLIRKPFQYLTLTNLITKSDMITKFERRDKRHLDESRVPMRSSTWKRAGAQPCRAPG